jgi:hypothetical protein
MIYLIILLQAPDSLAQNHLIIAPHFDPSDAQDGRRFLST